MKIRSIMVATYLTVVTLLILITLSRPAIVQAGSGVFSDSGQPLGSLDSRDVELGDVDGDGDLDAFVANADFPGEANRVWLNSNSQR